MGIGFFFLVFLGNNSARKQKQRFPPKTFFPKKGANLVLYGQTKCAFLTRFIVLKFLLTLVVPSLSSHTNRSPHRPLPKTIWSTKNVTMRPTIITRTGQGFNRQAVVSREETEQLDLSSGGLNITLRQRKRDSRWRVKRLFRSRLHRLSLPL